MRDSLVSDKVIVILDKAISLLLLKDMTKRLHLIAHLADSRTFNNLLPSTLIELGVSSTVTQGGLHELLLFIALLKLNQAVHHLI